jgi:hypothetical protein
VVKKTNLRTEVHGYPYTNIVGSEHEKLAICGKWGSQVHGFPYTNIVGSEYEKLAICGKWGSQLFTYKHNPAIS